jgi:hypothetical protein
LAAWALTVVLISLISEILHIKLQAGRLMAQAVRQASADDFARQLPTTNEQLPISN